MDFADFTGGNNEQYNNPEDEIQVESMGYNEFANQNQNQNFYNNENPSNAFGWEPEVNKASNTGYNDFAVFEVDEEEEKRLNARKTEEDERRSKIVQKMNDEIRIKQEFRDKARDYIDRFRESRESAMEKRQAYNKTNEADFLQNRQLTKEGKNPWERVVENIEVKETDYKGTKDVSRMRNVILGRKGDFVQMKMK